MTNGATAQTDKVKAPEPLARHVNDACQLLGISRSHLYDLAAAGKVKLIKIGGRTLIPEAELRRLANDGTA